MAERVTELLIRHQATELQRIDVSAKRALELAEEVEQLNSCVLKAAENLEFDDEPAAFTRMLTTTVQPEQVNE